MAEKLPSVFGLSPEFQTELDQAELRKQLAAAMLGRQQPPVQGGMVGKHYVRSNPLQHLAQILDRTFQRQGLDAAQGEISGIKRRAAQAEGDEREKIVSALTGQNRPAADGMGPPHIIPPNSQQAERLALQARFPGNRSLHDALLNQRMKLFEAGSKVAGGPSVLAAAKAGGNPALLNEKVPPEIQFSNTPDGTPYVFTKNPDDGETKFQLGRLPSKVSATANAGGPLLKEGGEFALKQVEKSKDAVISLPKQLRSIQEAMNALQGVDRTGATSGITQNLQQIARKLLGDMGIDAGADAFDTLRSRLADITIQSAGGLGRQISDADRDFIANATGSTLQNPNALLRALSLAAAGSMADLGTHGERVTLADQKFPETRGAAELASVPWRFHPTKEAAPLIEAVLGGGSTFDVLPATPQKNIQDVPNSLPKREISPEARKARIKQLEQELGIGGQR